MYWRHLADLNGLTLTSDSQPTSTVFISSFTKELSVELSQTSLALPVCTAFTPKPISLLEIISVPNFKKFVLTWSEGLLVLYLNPFEVISLSSAVNAALGPVHTQRTFTVDACPSFIGPSRL